MRSLIAETPTVQLATSTMNSDERVNSLGMFRYAVEFRRAAHIVDMKLGMQVGYELRAPSTVYYLLGHAIELTLKAFLMQNGIVIEKLRKQYRHDLVKCFLEAQSRGLATIPPINATDCMVLKLFNDLYSTKQFEYFERGMKNFPSPGLLQDLANRLIEAVAEHIPSAQEMLNG